MDGNAHRQHHQTLVRERVEKLFGGPKPPYSVFVPNRGTHYEYVKGKKKDYIWDWRTQNYVWDYPDIWTQLPGSWQKNPEYERWERIEEQVEQEIVKPTGSWHPYQRGGAGRSKKDGRSRGNRRFRRAIKQALPKYDAEEDLLPEKNEHYNKWDIWG